MTRRYPDNNTGVAARVALFPGSFNPFTVGHDSVVRRALQLFDRVVIAIGCNLSKPGSMDDAGRRADALRRHYAAEIEAGCIEVMTYSGLTVDACRDCGASFMLRGVRTVADFEYERTLADVNRAIAGIETVMLPTLPELAAISSSMVRELKSYGRDTSAFTVADCDSI